MQPESGSSPCDATLTTRVREPVRKMLVFEIDVVNDLGGHERRSMVLVFSYWQEWDRGK